MTRADKTVATPKGSSEAPAPKPARPTAAKRARPAPATAGTSGAASGRESGARPSGSQVPEAPVPDKFLEEQRHLLLTERETYTRQAAVLRAEAEQLAEEMEPGDVQFDEESGEGGTMNVERERDLALSAQAMAAVEEIDRALAKLDKGTYGVCERCGQPIKKARLKALPYASLCVECKTGGLSRR